MIYDADTIEATNLNRLVGATESDVREKRKKTEIAERVIRGANESAQVRAIPKRWQEDAVPLRTCDVIFGSVDSSSQRREIEATCRRHFVPYIDIGMDVHTIEGHAPRMAGQVILSMPGRPCMHCLGFLNEQNLAAEARKYGDAGPAPQVVWANGILASAAVGIWIDLLTGWSGRPEPVRHVSYDGNSGTLTEHPLLQYVERVCPHYPLSEAGDPFLKPVGPTAR